jgi:hypothetical protein
MNDRTFFLGWQDKESRAWYPVGRLDAKTDNKSFRFAYTRGALEAEERSGFVPLYDFPDFNGEYQSDELFPLFKNRIMTPGRRGFQQYLKLLDLEGMEPEPLDILAVDGGYRATDSFQVFPKITKEIDGCFKTRFFLHGSRYAFAAARERLEQLITGEELYVTVELTNPATTTAVQIQSKDYQVLGWAPRYLVHDLVGAMVASPGDIQAKVVRVNAAPAPSKQRVLIEMSGHWPQNYQPMQYEGFESLV